MVHGLNPVLDVLCVLQDLYAGRRTNAVLLF